MTIKLTDTQLVLLSAAAQRDNRCLVAGQHLKGGAAQKIASKLISLGVVREIRSKPGAPVWRRDEAGDGVSLKMTAEGMKAIALDENEPADGESVEPKAVAAPPNSARSGRSRRGQPSPANPTADDDFAGSRSGTRAPRASSKLALVIGLLQREEGATLGALVAATGWQPHTTRAAITGLRKRDYAVSLDRSDKERGSTYRIEAKAGERPAPSEVASAPNVGRGRRRSSEGERQAA